MNVKLIYNYEDKDDIFALYDSEKLLLDNAKEYYKNPHKKKDKKDKKDMKEEKDVAGINDFFVDEDL